MQWNNLADILRERAGSNSTGITFIEGSSQEDFLSYKELYSAALTALLFLQNKGIRPKEELVFQVEDNKSFIILFWACLLGGIIPVPLSIGQNDEHKQKLFNIWPVLKSPWLAIAQHGLPKLGAFAQQKGLESLHTRMVQNSIDISKIASMQGKPQLFNAAEYDTAFIQFSSGSTGTPKGVVLSHKNLTTNINAISKAAGYTARDATLSWMPLTHDMGMIGFHLNPLYCGMNQYLIPTNGFIRRPSIWLDKVSEHKVSILCSPNFGYKYFIKHYDVAEEHHWDLSNVRILYNGAEPVSEKICREFLGCFAKYGLKSNAMCPVYGLAEATLAVSISGLEDEVISIAVDRNALNPGNRILERTGEQAVTLVNVGRPVNDCSIRITDDNNNVVEDETVGHVQIQGAAVTAGYYNNEAATRQVLHENGWLQTGDVGFLKEGCLYITGRAKDIIFVNGQNFYSNDLEQLAEAIEGIELNKIAITGSFNTDSQQEEVIALVFHRGSIEEFIPTGLSVKKFIADKTGIELDKVLPVKDIPRTTSGKLQRFKLVERMRNGDFNEVAWQVSQLMEQWNGRTSPLVRPGNDDERRVLDIWGKVLGHPAISVDQSFFEAGGNSLKAAEMTMMLLKEFQTEVPLEVVYDKPTIRELAREVRMPGKPQYRPIPVAEQRNYYPVSTAQKRLYFFQELNKDSIAYNTPVAFRVNGNLQKDKLVDCMKKMIARHDSLRMTFRLMDEPVFFIQNSMEVNIEELECNYNEINTKLTSLVQPFDITAGPLFRIRLLNIHRQEYVLFIDFHHLITDGLSVYHFMRELFDLYKGNELPVLSVRYADYAVWEKNNQASAKTALQETYWLNHLHGDLPRLAMPTDFHRPAIFNTAGGKMEFLVNNAVAGRLAALAKENQVRLHVVMFSLYSVLLSKYTGQEDLVIGIPVAGRQHPDLQNLQGMFVNNLAIRSSVNPGETFIQLLKRQHNNILQALSNQDYPFDALIRRIGSKHTVDRNPLFDTMFVYQNMGQPSVKDGDLCFSRYFFDPGFSRFDISMEVFDDGQTLHYAIEYAAKLFRPTTIQRLAMHFDHLIRMVIDHPDSPVASLSLITGYEYNLYINSFNATQKPYPCDKTIHRLFEEQVARTPDKIALEFRDKMITYRQLNDQAAQLAGMIREKGLKPGCITGLLLHRSPELIISMLGILKAGGCYLPMDTGLPEERIKLLITDSQCPLVITGNSVVGKEWLHKLPGVQVLRMDDPGLPTGSPLTEQVGSPDDLAYIIYTSGTTGKPKGVMIEHRSLVNYCWWAAEQYVKGEKATFALFTPVSFDLTVTSVFIPLITGNKIVIYEEDDKSLLVDKILADNKANVIKLTPSHLKIISENKQLLQAGNSSIRRLIAGGEELTSPLAKDIYELFDGHIEIYNEYGPTEATVGCMIHLFDPAAQHRTVPIGIPAANTQIYILDKFLHPVPEGVYGEIYIAGDGVARGYLFNDALTAQKVLANPFVKGKKMYRTGDMARRLPEGIIEFAGRYDQQVKINGYRIELPEIESHLRECPGIEDALVTIRTDKSNQPRLVACYKSKEPIEEITIRHFLAGRLPHYMVPVHFIRMEAFPLTGNGKVNHNALPAPGINYEGAEGLVPKNDIEALSLKIWENILGEKQLRVTDNFFELGGDSIKAVQIAARLFDNGISLSVKDILTYQTIEQISLHATTGNGPNRYEQGIVSGEIPLSPIDTWFFSHDFANPGYYNQSILLRLNRKVSGELLEKAFTLLIAHHDGLRINYDPQKQVLFYNNRHLETAFILEKYETDTGTALAETCMRLKSSFNITQTILIKAAIIQDAVHEKLLFITAHHLVIDGVSWRILLEDLHTTYLALEKGTTFAMRRKTATRIDWIKRLQEYATSGASRAAAWHWQDTGNNSFTLPQDVETNDWTTRNAYTITGQLSREKTSFLIKEAHKVYNTDMPILLNTALVLTLREWTGLDRVVVEQEHHGRHWNDVDASRTIGWFTTLYPIQLVVHDDTIANQLMAVKEQMRGIPDQGVGYGIGKYCSGQYSTAGWELTSVRLNYLGQFDQELNNDLFSYMDLATGNDSDPANLMTARLELNAIIIDGGFRVAITYNQKAHQQKLMNWLRDTFLTHLHRILDHLAGEEKKHFTPSDFNAVELDQEELDSLFK